MIAGAVLLYFIIGILVVKVIATFVPIPDEDGETQWGGPVLVMAFWPLIIPLIIAAAIGAFWKWDTKTWYHDRKLRRTAERIEKDLSH